MLGKLVITFGASVVIMLLNIIGGILTARFLGPAGKGELTAVIIWPSILAGLGSLGLVDAIVFFSGKNDKSDVQAILSNSLGMAFLQSLVLIGIGWLVLPSLMGNYDPAVIGIARIYLLFIPLNLVSLYLLSVFQGTLHIKTYNTIRILVNLLYTAGIVVLWWVDSISVRNCALLLLLSNGVTIGYELFWVIKNKWLQLKPSLKLLRSMISYGLRVQLGNIFTYLNLRLDQMVMAVFLPPMMLGLYAVAVTMSGGVNLISGTITAISFPKIASVSEEINQVQQLGRFLRVNIWISGFVVILLLILIPYLVPLLFGLAYTGSVQAAQILTIAAMVLGINSILAAGVKGLGRPIISSYGEILGLFFTGVFLYLLLPKYQIIGAAYTSLLAYTASFIFLYGYVWHTFRLPPKEIIFPKSEDILSIGSAIKKLRQTSREVMLKWIG